MSKQGGGPGWLWDLSLDLYIFLNILCIPSLERHLAQKTPFPAVYYTALVCLVASGVGQFLGV